MNKAILHAIIIYTLAGCSYCMKAKALLDKKEVAYEEIEVQNSQDPNVAVLRKKLNNPDRLTFPQIFIDNMHIGGCDDLYDLDKEGRLDKLLEGQPKKDSAAVGA
ncbi:MAG TPA: glutaredoxin 3 [Rickettsia endosymbiont of Bembidion nr. Transversale]|nr:glutaredoxin 3 [Rickettsia endosymbiont of Stiretrus anchorago]HJD66446.1 glutaredoxin 3 [Rickettsia endosymbiont of Bembidion nr. Transversale]